MLTVLKKKEKKQQHMVFSREDFPDVTDLVTKATPVSRLEHPVLRTDPSTIKLAGFSSKGKACQIPSKNTPNETPQTGKN